VTRVTEQPAGLSRGAIETVRAASGQYNLERLLARRGVKLPDLLVMLANYEKARSFSIYDRCKARYARYYGPA